MPTIFHYDGYRFFFYSNEGDPREPMHVHVMKAGCEAKFWLRPVVRRRTRGSTPARSGGWSRWSRRGGRRSKELGVTISAETVRFEGEKMWVGLSDGRVIGVPLTWFPRLLRATPAEREALEISPFGLHWAALDEDVSVEGLLAGRGDRGRVGGEAA